MNRNAAKVTFFVGGSMFGALLASVYHQRARPTQTPPPPPPSVNPPPAYQPPAPLRPAPPVAVVPGTPPPFTGPKATPVAHLPPPPPYTPAPATDETKVPVKNETARVLEALGHPGPIADTGYFGSYVSNFNRQLRNPNWVFEHLTAENLRREAGEKDPDRSNSAFREDTRIPMLFRARLKDYFKSGYDRGHMAPAADAKRSQGAMDDTFLLTNMCPQVGMGFNRDYWSHFETFTRRLTKSFSDVYVFTGPLYLPKPIPGSPNKYKVEYEVIGSPPNIAVPTHFYKVILVKNAVGKYSAGGFVLPNAVIPDDAPLESFVLPISAIEKAAGLTFFDKVPEIAIPGASAPLCASTLCSLTESQAYVTAVKKRKALKAPSS